MIRLDRSTVVEPAEWKARVENALADAKLFRQKAKAFEKLQLNGKKRRAGFKAYAGHLLFVATDHDFPAVWRVVKEIKISLIALSAGHCSYCQRSVEDDKYPGEVEHFKPKSLFPTLAYDWNNFLLGCPRCNMAKSDKWPEQGAYVRPDEGDPAKRFVFDERGRVKAAPGDADAKATVLDFGLNRPGLRKLRKGAIRQVLRALRPILEMPGLTDEQRRTLAKALLMKRLSPFSEAVNQNVRRMWCTTFPDISLCFDPGSVYGGA